MKLFPHKVLHEDHVKWGEWHVITADSSEVLLDHLKGWDYQQGLALQAECQINVASACEALDVAAEEINLLATIDCPATSRRFVATDAPSAAAHLHAVESDYDEWERWSGAAGHYYVGYWEEGETWAVTDSVDVVLEETSSRDEALSALRSIDASAQESWRTLTCTVDIPPESVAKRLDLALQFVVNPRASNGHRPGARVLVGPKKHTLIEGDGARFPTEPVSFKAMGWPPALWKVNFAFESPEDAFAGAVRLFVNIDHPGASALLDPQAPSGQITRAFLRQDIVRVVLSTLAHELRGVGALAASSSEDESSIMAVANSLAHDWLKLDVDEAASLIERSPADFETRIQAAGLDLGKKAFE